ncbi:MAG: LysM peptidoglycan-binding domain-containing protein, partial [Bacteroidota bacterium]
RETRGYVPAFIGAAYTMEYYREHNIVPNQVDFPMATDTIMIIQELHLGQVADVLGIDMRLLQDLNPQYRRDIIPACSEENYPLLLPVEYAIRFIDLQDSVYNYKDSVYFNKSKGVITSPPVYSSDSYTPSPPSENMEAVSYTIKAGDNLGYIACWFNVKVNDVRYWNNIDHNLIRAGQKMIIYVDKKDVEKYKKVDGMSFEAKQKMIGKTVAKTETTTNTTTTTTSKDDGKGKYLWYTVKSGDNFWTIAKKYEGVSNTDIMELNGITDPGSLKPGQKIKIKRLD